MTKKLLTIPLSEEEINTLERYCQQTNRTKAQVVGEYIRSLHTRPRESLFKEILHLKQELEEIKQEKADLELLLETIADHSSTIEDQFKNQAKAAQRETEEQFQAITEAMPVAVFISRLDTGEVLYANRTAATQFQSANGSLVGDGMANYCAHPLDYQKLVQQFEQQGAVRGYELLCQRGDRLLFWMNASLHTLKYKGEETILWALSDIHTLKQAKEDLNRAKEQLQAVLDAIPGSVSWLTCEGYYLGVNPYLAQKFGLKGEDFIDQPIGFLRGGGAFTQLITEFIHSPEVSISQEIKLDLHGKNEYVLIAAQKYNRGQAIVTVGFDITQRKQAEEALRIAEENYRSIFENALEGIFQSSPDGRYISVNPAMARICGYDSPQDMMANVNQICHEIYVNCEDREWFQEQMETAGSVQNWEYQIYRRDRTKIWISEDTRAVRDATGKVLYYEGIIQEITKRKQQEQDLKRQVEELRIEIDQQKRDRQVTEITQSSYFQELQAELATLTFDDDDI